MARITIDDVTIYQGPLIAVPHAGDEIFHNGEVVRVETATWRFDGVSDDAVTVTLDVSKRPYTF